VSSSTTVTAVATGPSSESSTSSRDCSPSRSSPFGMNVHSPVVLRRGARGYGFSLTAIRVFYGDSGYFTLHHMISVRTTRPQVRSGCPCRLQTASCLGPQRPQFRAIGNSRLKACKIPTHKVTTFPIFPLLQSHFSHIKSSQKYFIAQMCTNSVLSELQNINQTSTFSIHTLKKWNYV